MGMAQENKNMGPRVNPTTHRDDGALTGSGYKSLESLDVPPPRGLSAIQSAQSGAGAQAQSAGAAACDIDD